MPMAKVGDKVTKGQLLLKFDIPFIQSKGLSVVTPVLLSNSAAYGTVETASAGKVNVGDVIMRYKA